MRTIISLPDAQLRALAEVCQKEGISRAEAIRRAVEQYTRERLLRSQEDAFGLWRDRDLDGIDYERQLRGEW